MHQHAGYVRFAPLAPNILFQATIGADTTFDPNVSGFSATGVDWDFGGGAANITGGSGSQSVALTGTPVTVRASTFENVPATWTLNSRSDEYTQFLEFNDQVRSIDIGNNGNVGDASDAALTNLPNLDVLDIRNLAFTTKSLAGLTSLRVLFAQGNNIGVLPDFTDAAATLRTLLLDDNALTGTTDFSPLVGITDLRANNNSGISSVILPAGAPILNLQLELLSLSTGNFTPYMGTLTQLRIGGNDYDASFLDQMIIDLDAAGFTGTLGYGGQSVTGPNTGDSAAFDVNRSGPASSSLANLLGAGVTRLGTYA